MKAYIGVKLIDAEPMTRGEYNHLKGWNIPENENPDDTGFLVQYSSDYISWSPTEPFEGAYQEINPDGMEFDTTGMTFESHQYRVVQEFDELFDKLEGLSKFVLGDIYKTLDNDEQVRLRKQLLCMVMYRDVLYERIITFKMEE